MRERREREEGERDGREIEGGRRERMREKRQKLLKLAGIQSTRPGNTLAGT